MIRPLHPPSFHMSETQRLHIAAAAAHYHFVVPRRPQDASSAARSCLRRRLCSLRMTEAEPCEHACMPDACMQHQSQGCATRHTHAQNKLQRWNKRGVERRLHTYLGNTASFYRLLSGRLQKGAIMGGSKATIRREREKGSEHLVSTYF